MKWAFVIVSMLAVALGGCGYATQSLHPGGVKTVAVEVFENESYRRGDELTLTHAIVQEIEKSTPYRIADARHADTLLTGRLTDAGTHTIASDTGSAIPSEQLYVLTADFEWKDLRSGRVLVRRENVEQASPLFPTLGEGTFVGGTTAAEALAKAIVAELEADW